MLIFFFFLASALSALHLYNEPKFMVIGNPVKLEQSHAHNAPDLRDRGSRPSRSPHEQLRTQGFYSIEPTAVHRCARKITEFASGIL